MTRKNQLIWTLIPLGAILLMGAVVLLLCQQITPAPAQEVERMHLEDVSQYDERELPVFVVVNGPQQRTQSYLKRYPIHPVEGYTQTTDASLTANRESDHYVDRFLGRGRKVTLLQKAVANQDRVEFLVDAQPQEVTFQGMQVIYYISDVQSGAYWLYEDSLLELSVTGWMKLGELLGWVERVDLEHPVSPKVTPLTFLPSYREEIAGESGVLRDSNGWQVAGNPRQDPANRFFHLSKIPEGFTLSSPAVRSGNVPLDQWAYANSQGDRILLNNLRITGYTNCNIFTKMPVKDYTNPEVVQSVTVGGREGRLYCTGDYAELVVLGQDVAGQLIYQGTITPQAMLELGESLVLE